ncbi:hypothetical protein D6821_02025 [Candidatus Parcubacteria bacterium]|nr:MAG: hypothetical protein D6821_02025 [Candidatus Parcubacteria bacterium]
MAYLIDGNNLAGHLNLLDRPQFDRLLIKILAHYCRLSGKKVCVVFDGGGFMGDRWQKAGVKVIYAPHDGYYHSADDVILEMLEVTGGGAKPILVTNDLDLRRKAQELGAQTISCEAWRNKIAQQGVWPPDNQPQRKQMSEKQSDAITEELRRLWCGE